jgi:hypothetical protein
MLNQLTRYQPVVELVEGSGPPGSLLEVGSGSRGIAAYVSSAWAITACDRDFADYGAVTPGAGGGARRVVGDVLDLPFKDREFDVVVALDLLEHVPPGDRRRALSELARVGGRRVIVGCPCGPEAERSDRRLAEYYVRIGRQPPGWLTEHREHGFPRPQELREGLGGERVRLLPNESVAAHERLSRVEARGLGGAASLWAARALASGVRPSGNALARRAIRALRAGDAPPVYRTLAVLER